MVSQGSHKGNTMRSQEGHTGGHRESQEHKGSQGHKEGTNLLKVLAGAELSQGDHKGFTMKVTRGTMRVTHKSWPGSNYFRLFAHTRSTMQVQSETKLDPICTLRADQPHGKIGTYESCWPGAE